MKIEPSGVPPLNLSGANFQNASSAVRNSERSGEGAAPVSGDAQSFTPTSGLSNLISAVHNDPEVRSDRVAEARQKLASGELLSREAAADTAKSLLNQATTGG